MGFMQVGLTGLNAAQLGLATTSHNIANSSTPGYSRQNIVQTTTTPLYTGSGFVGQGTSVTTVVRSYNQFLSAQILSAQTNVASNDAYSAQIAQIDNLLADPSAGLTPALTDFFSAIQDLSANPSSSAARQSVLSGAQSLVSRFQSIDQRIVEVRDGVNNQIISEAGKITQLAREIGNINQRIIEVQASSGQQSANDLLDQRDQMINDLNKEIRVQAVTQGDGTVNVFIGNGQPLVVGAQVSQLSAVEDPNDIEKMTLSIRDAYGRNSYVTESEMTGGAMGGLLAFRNEVLDTVENAVGRVALGVVDTFNQIHALGQDLNGAMGGKFFNTSDPVVKASSLNGSPSTKIAAQIINSDYRVTANAAGNFDIVRLSDNTALVTNGTLPAVVDGVKISFSTNNTGTVAAGDTFLVKPDNTAGSRVIPESDNTGTATLDSTGSNLSALGTSDYRLQYSGNNQWTLTRLSDSASWTASDSSPTLALDKLQTLVQTGISLTLSGTPPLTGDSFLIQPTHTAARNLTLAINNPAAIAAGMAITTSATKSNTGTATISSGDVQDKSYLPLTGNITLTYDSTLKQFAVGGATPAVGNINYDPTTQSSITINANGLSFTVTGAPANGDTFTVKPNTNGVSDNRTIVKLGALQTANTLAGTANSTTNGATSTFQSAYSQIVSLVGNKARAVDVEAKAQQTLADQATTSRDSVSGVNLDEEAANLMKYQQAYQASAKILDIAGKLFDQILQMG